MAELRGDMGPHIGSILKETRTRRGLDIRTVEEQTRIRTKYLRALENEDWDALPGPAYVRGFLRTYATLLGLDAEALVDEYRRRVEHDPSHPYGLGEPVLRERRVVGGGGWRPGWRLVVGVLVAVVAILLLVLGLTDGSDDKEGRGKRAAKQERQEREPATGGEDEEPLPDTVTVKLVARSPTEVCLVSGSGEVLLDNLVLADEAEEGPFVAERFELALGPGVVDLSLNGESQRLESDVPLSYSLTPRGARGEAPDPSPDCP